MDDSAWTSSSWAEPVRREGAVLLNPLPLSASYIFSKCDTDGRLEALIRVRN